MSANDRADVRALYSFDSSSLIVLAERYPIQVFPPVWERMAELLDGQKGLVSEEVVLEIEKKSDELSDWLAARSSLPYPSDIAVQHEMKRIVARFPSLVEVAKGRGAADPFVIAVAIVHKAVVVTEEFRKPTRPRIPDAAEALGVPVRRMIDVMKESGWVFR